MGKLREKLEFSKEFVEAYFIRNCNHFDCENFLVWIPCSCEYLPLASFAYFTSILIELVIHVISRISIGDPKILIKSFLHLFLWSDLLRLL